MGAVLFVIDIGDIGGKMNVEQTYKIALEKILDYWVNTQDAPPEQPRIQWAEEMADIACDALDYVRGVDKEKPEWLP